MTDAFGNRDDAPEIPELPWFLKRDASNQSEITKMTPAVRARPVMAPEAEAGAAKPAKVKAAPKAPAKAAAKPAPKATAKPAKAKPPVKAAAKAPAKKAKAKERKVREYDPAKLDQYGFRLNSAKSNAAVLYAAKGGATLGEIKVKLGSTQFNVLTQLRELGYTIDEKQEDGKGNRKITRYFLRAKK